MVRPGPARRDFQLEVAGDRAGRERHIVVRPEMVCGLLK
jgi:hypothetical protein